MRARIDLWWLDLPNKVRPADLELLDTAERTRAQGFRKEQDAAAFVARRAGRRRALAGQLGVPPEKVVVGRAPCPRCASSDHGPPTLVWPDTPLAFSTSRSGRTALIAISFDLNMLGVDVERHTRTDLDALAARVLSPAERGTFARAGSDRHRTFYRAWARKEALLKAMGVGIVERLAALDTKPHLVEAAVIEGPDGQVWRAVDLSTDPDLTAQLLTPGPAPGELRFHRRAPDPDPDAER